MPRSSALARLQRAALAASFALAAAPAQDVPPELAIRRASPVVDGELADWPTDAATIRLEASARVVQGRDGWTGPADGALVCQIACDGNHLYLGGVVRDDQVLTADPSATSDTSDHLEVWLGAADAGTGASPPAVPLFLAPLQPERPWTWGEAGANGGRQSGTQLAGVRVAGRRTDPTSYQFEVAVPFHHIASIEPGAVRLAFDLVLRDADPASGGTAGPTTVLSWAGTALVQNRTLGALRLPEPGALVSSAEPRSLFASRLLDDAPWVLVPLATVVALGFVLRGWNRVERQRSRWRPWLLGLGVAAVLVGLVLPGRLAAWRGASQRADLERTLATLQGSLDKLEQGTLASYRGASRDRAVVDLLQGKSIARQRYTRYRSLAQLAPDQFGPPLCDLDGLPVRPYWIPLPEGRPETFQFDPPLRGTKVHVVLGRPFVPSFARPQRRLEVPQLRLELDGGAANRRQLDVDLRRPFADAAPLGRDFFEACIVPVAIDRELRALTIGSDSGADLHLVGLSLEGESIGVVEPLQLGEPSLGGVLTDLRGPWPADAGIELAPGATAKIAVARLDEPPQKLWLVYRASYPGVATANPGARVAEVVLHFAEGEAKRTLVLEHQISMFYELAVHNTRDGPPPGSPAAIALTWVDPQKEKRQNLVYPVLDLPPHKALDAIELRNVSGYRIRFRSIVFGNERAAAPQDPVDSPLVRDGQEWRLRDDVLAALRRADVTIYRGGRASETTRVGAGANDAAPLPRAVAGGERAIVEEVLQDGSRHVAIHTPLGGDGWDGAVLAVSSRDPDWASAGQTGSRIGFLLGLLGAPLVLVLLSELLVASTNLRVRLMAVMTVAALLPLAVLSFVLVRVLESGNDKDIRGNMLATVRNAATQLTEQKDRLKGSARQWLRDLAALVGDRTARLDKAQFAVSAGPITAELQKLLASQLPPEWGGGFSRLEWQPAQSDAPDPLVVVAGDPRMAHVEAPTRLEPGLFMQWGALWIGVRAEEKTAAGSLALVIGRPVGSTLLGALAPGQQATLTDVRGYPLAVNGGRASDSAQLARAMDPRVMAERERVLAESAERREPVVMRTASVDGPMLSGHEVLRDLQDTPRGLLVVTQQDQRATLDLAIGRVPVRAFFLAVGGCLIVLAAFLAWVVSGRISRPIEQLERGAQALSRGALDTRVEEEGGGEVERLTRTFNTMAAQLQARLQDLQALNRTIRELTAETDEATTLGVLQRFFAMHTGGDALRVVLLAKDGKNVVVHPTGEELPTAEFALTRLAGPFSTVPTADGGASPWLRTMQGTRSAIGWPIVFAGRTRGIVLLGFATHPPAPIDVELLGTVVAQAALAFERALLHRSSVRDPVTGAFTTDYFRQRVADEVSLAQQRERPLALFAMTLGSGERRPRGLRRFTAWLLERLPEAIVCHTGAGVFHVALPNGDRAAADRVTAEVRTAWSDVVRGLPDGEAEGRVSAGVVVQFPDDAPSAEFLFEALAQRLVAAQLPAVAANETDDELLRAGVTAISPAMRGVWSALRRVAPTDLPVLLEGETGVGKEVLTNLVHRWSRRAAGPLVKVHCAALSETLLASELFGHEKGAFTGADRRKIGRFEQASSGTLFLDEVGDIPLEVQVKLLRVLQEGEIDRVGGTETVPVDVRVIAATNRDIAAMVREGLFREDLYYRLRGLVVRVPPLRERKPELAPLVEHFVREVAASGRGRAKVFSSDAMDALYRQDWPGNVRELRHTVLRAMALAPTDVVHARDVLLAIAGTGAAPVGQAVPTEPGPGPEPTVVLPRAEPVLDRLGGDEVGSEAAGGAPHEPVFTLATLPARLRALLTVIEARGTYSTQDHMTATGVSHRTGLRDLQALVRAGLIERVGSRRGAFYRPSHRGDRLPRAEV